MSVADSYNYLTITGPKEEIEKFKNAALGPNEECSGRVYKQIISLKSLFPCPQGISIDSKAAWRMENWGTLGLYPDETHVREDSDNCYSIKFTSHATPPISAFNKISGDYPELDFELKYWGFTDGWCGGHRFKNGETVDTIYFENDEYEALFTEEDTQLVEPSSPNSRAVSRTTAPIKKFWK